MRALVTGGAGFIGTNLINQLLKDGHEVVSIDNYSTGFKENEQAGCVYFDRDIFTELPQIDTDVVFHMAAKARIQPSFEHPRSYFDSNVRGTINVLEYAKRKGTKVVYAGSSSYHYGIYKNMYTFSKWQGEELCKLYTEVFDVPIAICRFYNVFGEYMSPRGDNAVAISIFQDQYLKKVPLTITGNGKQRRDFTYVGDIVDGLIKASEYDGEIIEFELGSGNNCSINELASWFGGEIEYIPSIFGEAMETLRVNNSAINELKWAPKTNVKNWIESWVENNK